MIVDALLDEVEQHQAVAIFQFESLEGQQQSDGHIKGHLFVQEMDLLVDFQEIGIDLGVFGEAQVDALDQIEDHAKLNILIVVDLLQQFGYYLFQLEAAHMIADQIGFEVELALSIDLHTRQNLILQH